MRVQKVGFHNTFGLAVRRDQQAFVCADLEEYVRSWASDSLLEAFLILNRDQPVGFFALDFSIDRHSSYLELDTKEGSVAVLRNFFIDERFQGLGLARASLGRINSLLRESYPSVQTLLLTVNVKNAKAAHAYRAAGFEQKDALYLGGQAGPQYVMSLSLERNLP